MTTHHPQRILAGVALAASLAALVWCNGAGEGGAQEAAQASAAVDQATTQNEKAVRALIDRYFSTWSAKDIDRYGQCFMPQAAVQIVDADGKLITMPLRKFLETQREAHKGPEPMVERPESVEIRFEAQLARVIVFWKLTIGDDEVTGYDHFTLMQSGGQWRIANLIFYESAQLAP